MPPPPAPLWRTHRRGRARKARAFHVSERDWGELPADVILCVLHKLDQVDLLLGGVAGLCRSWRRAAREEPELWRHIDVRSLPFTRQATCENFTRAALRLSAGQCHTFAGELLDDDLLLFLAQR